MTSKTPKDLSQLFDQAGVGRKLKGLPDPPGLLLKQVSHEFLYNTHADFLDSALTRKKGLGREMADEYGDLIDGRLKAANSPVMREWIKDAGFDPDKLFEISHREQHRLSKLLFERIKAEGNASDGVFQRNKVSVQVEHAEGVENMLADAEALYKALDRGLVMEKPTGSSWHHLTEYLGSREFKTGHFMAGDVKKLWDSFQSIVIEHNWAAAFASAKDFDGGEIVMPFDYTVFEFRISGIRVLVTIGNEGETYRGVLFLGHGGRWYHQELNARVASGQIIQHPFAAPKSVFDEFHQAVMDTLCDQIRAICIVIESGVAQSERVNQDESVNRRRVKQGKSPLKDYHVVSLARKHREKADREPGDGTGSPRRCHYRRGHWRVFKSPTSGREKFIGADGFEQSRTRIAWMLVGDPNLGFVDKHYKL